MALAIGSPHRDELEAEANMLRDQHTDAAIAMRFPHRVELEGDANALKDHEAIWGGLSEAEILDAREAEWRELEADANTTIWAILP